MIQHTKYSISQMKLSCLWKSHELSSLIPVPKITLSLLEPNLCILMKQII
jgi:hypothetical protein